MKRRTFLALLLGLSAVGSLAAKGRHPSPPIDQVDTAAVVVRSDRAQEIVVVWNRGGHDEARRRAKEWRKANKKDVSAWLISAEVAIWSGDPKKALKFGKKALSLAPHSAEAYAVRGRAFEALEKPLEAANEYRAALLAESQFPPAQNGLDRVLARLGSEFSTGED